MAVSTDKYIEHFFMFLPKTVRPGTTFMGCQIPIDVTHTAVRHTVEADAIQVQWKTKHGACHEIELQHPLTSESITTLLVSMRLSC
jgi:hypothetical protein